MRLFSLISFLVILHITSINAHGDLDLRIQALTSAIEVSPDSGALYFIRGKLRFQHEEYQASVEDINISIVKGFHDELQKIYLAKSLYKLEIYESANQYLIQFLENNPNSIVGLNLKGRILYAQHKYEASALCFENVIRLTIKSLPENYLEAAHSWSESTHPNKYDKMVNILELGLENLGLIVTLQNKLIETHLQAKNRNEVLKIQYTIIEKSKRKETAYFKLAKIYIQLDELENAKEAAVLASSHWEKLPRRIRMNSAMKSLKNEIELFKLKLP